MMENTEELRNLSKETGEPGVGIQVCPPNIRFPAHCFPHSMLSVRRKKWQPQAINKGIFPLPLPIMCTHAHACAHAHTHTHTPPPSPQAHQGREKSASVLKINLSPPSIMKNNRSLSCRGGGHVKSGTGLNWNWPVDSFQPSPWQFQETATEARLAFILCCLCFCLGSTLTIKEVVPYAARRSLRIVMQR